MAVDPGRGRGTHIENPAFMKRKWTAATYMTACWPLNAIRVKTGQLAITFSFTATAERPRKAELRLGRDMVFVG